MKLQNLVVNCFSIKNNGGYKDIISIYEGYKLDDADFHMFVDELANELIAYNEQLHESCKVTLTRKDAIREAIREAKRATKLHKGYHIVNTVDYMETYDYRFNELMAGKYEIAFA